MTRKRRHHNNNGRAQIKKGKTEKQVRRIARRLHLPLWSPRTFKEIFEFKQDIFKQESKEVEIG